MKKIIILGGMAAGCKTAARLRRLDPSAEITIIESLPFVSFGACGMPFFASGDVDNFEDLMSTAWGTVRSPEFFLKAKNIRVLVETTCTKIVPEHNFVEIVGKGGKKQILDYDYLVITTGSNPIEPNFEYPKSERISYFHSPLDAFHFRKLAEQGAISSAVIIGGGFIGCELAEAVSSLWGIDVTLIEKEDSLLPRYFDKEFSKVLETLYKQNGIKVLLNSKVVKIQKNTEKLIVLLKEKQIETDFVFLCLGIRPNIELARNSGILIGESGGISVDNNLRTNFENIFSAGDCIEITNLVTGRKGVFALGSLANRQGRVVADNIAGINSEFEGAVGCISLKVFDTIFASVGLSSYCALLENYEIGYAIGSFYDRPHYHPDTKVLFAKVVYEKHSGRLIGMQLCGKGEVTRYIDVFSVLLMQKATFKNLLGFEHSYTPPHSSPLNPLNFLGGMIENQERFKIVPISPLEIENYLGEWTIVDLRKESEILAMPTKFDCVRIDFDNLYEEVRKIEGRDKILCICQKGPRALEVAILLKHLGINTVGYLAGGLQLLNCAL